MGVRPMRTASESTPFIIHNSPFPAAEGAPSEAKRNLEGLEVRLFLRCQRSEQRRNSEVEDKGAAMTTKEWAQRFACLRWRAGDTGAQRCRERS